MREFFGRIPDFLACEDSFEVGMMIARGELAWKLLARGGICRNMLYIKYLQKRAAQNRKYLIFNVL